MRDRRKKKTMEAIEGLRNGVWGEGVGWLMGMG